MHCRAPILLLSSLLCLAGADSPSSPFHHNRRSGDDPDVVLRVAAATTCPIGYYSCASRGSVFAAMCCLYDEACALDAAGAPACCHAGDVCTGTAPTTYVTATPAVSYVPDAVYASFPYILPTGVAVTTALAGAAACDAVLGQCSAEYTLCTARLMGKAATTAAALAAASAVGLCSSLSSQACGGLPSDTSACAARFAESTDAASTTGFAVDSGGISLLSIPPLRDTVATVAVVSAFLAGAVGMIML